MAKRTKKVKSARSNLRVESLEQRQLLATIVAGSGMEVGSNIVHSNGNTYDQILMTGASVTVSADPLQVVRVSFLDQGGDIVQAEFSGKGTMTVSLEDVKTAASVGYINKNPAQGVNYVQGLATITIDKPELNTNLGIYAAGNLQNPGFFSKTDGDNGLADIARIILVGDPTNGAGYSNMGGIRAGSTVFSASTGAVGIRGENVAVQDIVAIGDIDAKGSGVPTLMFNTNSQFQNVFVRGGDLRQTNGASFDTFGAGSGGAPGGSPGNPNNVTIGGFSFFNSTDGTSSQGKLLWATPVDQSAIRLALIEQQTLMSGDWVYDWSNIQSVKVSQNGVDVSSVYGGDWLAKGGIQNSLDLAFERRSFLGNLTITGDLPAGFEMNLADARANVTFNNNVYGLLTVDGFGAGIDGTLTIKGNLDGTIAINGFDRAQPLAGAPGFGGPAPDGQQNVLNALVVEGSTGPFTDVRAEDIGSVTIRNNFSGIISTDVTRGNAWSNRSPLTATGFRDVEGLIGNVSIGFNAAGASTGGSIINGTIQGMSGIGNVRVGGDVYGTSPNQAVFVTQSNPGAAPTDVRNFGSANIGTIDIRGDVDLDTQSSNFIKIGNNGTFGNITVSGLTTTNTVPGVQIGTKTELIPGSESLIRVLSPFTDAGFTPNPVTGQKLVQNFDPDGVAGPLNDTYFVTAKDVAAGAQIYDIATGKTVTAKAGDRVPALSGGLPIIDTFGNVLYRQNTALFEGKTQIVPIFGPDVVTIVSGNRGNLNGVFNNFGQIEIVGLLGAQQRTTGTISISDNVDMTFGGVTVNSAGINNQNVIGTVGTIGQITINNTAGATSDLRIVGTIGSPNGAVAGTNGGTANIGLAGLNITGFEDVRFANVATDKFPANLGIHVTGITNGLNVTTVTGSGNGTGVGTVSPSVIFDSIIQLDNGTSESNQNALLSINTGLVNSTVGFTALAGIVVDDGGNTGSGSAIGPISLTSDYVFFSGLLSGRTLGAVTLTGGTGINSTSDTAVKFDGKIAATTIASITASATAGNVVFAPTSITGIGTKATNNGITPMATIGAINLTTAGTNSGGDIRFGNGSVYDVNTGDISITAGHKFFVEQAGTVLDNPGFVTINFATSGDIGNLVATTTTGDINSTLVIQGNAGNITHIAGSAVVDKLDTVGGVVGDLARFGNISTTQTIWGTRGVTTLETAGQNADGTAKALPDFVAGGVTYKLLPSGKIDATLNYAGASTAAGDAFIAKTGGGNATIMYNIIAVDDNKNGVIELNEIGNGGNVNVSSVSGDLEFYGGTKLPNFTTANTLGNVTLKTGSFAQPSGLITAKELGTITIGFNALDTDVAAGVQSSGGFEGKVGNISATTTGGDITVTGLANAPAPFANPTTTMFDGSVGTVTLTAGSVQSTSGLIVGSVNMNGGIAFNMGQGLVKATAVDIGTVTGTISTNGPANVGNTLELTTEFGALNVTIAAGSFDANNNGILTANEFGRTGDFLVTSKGGPITLNLNSSAYVSDLEQSMIGNITINNTPYIDFKAGATDVVGTGTSALGSAIVGAGGNITINGLSTQKGAVGNLTATTTVGTIAHTGVFGDLGTSKFTTTSFFDTDTNPNVVGEAPVLIADGDIVLGTGFNVAKADALIVNGKHGASTYSVTEAGTISGTAYYGGAATSATSLTASSVRGNISLAIWLQDADRDGSGNITATEYGTQGASNLSTTSGGDVTLFLGTDQNNAAVLARNLIPQFTFGAVTASVVDRYTSTSATVADVLADAGNITITGAGADATNALTAGTAAQFGPITGNRGNVGAVTAATVRGNLVLNGTFGGLGDQTLTVTRYLDVNGANTNTFAGNLTYSPSIYGTHGTAILRTTDLGAVGTGTISGGAIAGVATYGGALAAGKTVSLDARTERANINLDVLAFGYDINGDGVITDGLNKNTPGEFEFATVGDVLVETTAAGDITLGLGIASANGSTIGSKIGNVTAIANDDIYTEVANAVDTVVNLGNVTIIGKSSATNFSAGTIGSIGLTVATGDATLRGNFGSINGVTIVTSTRTDTSVVGGGSAVIAAGDIILGNSNTAADNAVADTAGLTTLNIAGSSGVSTFTVTEMGTITGEVFSAGIGGGDWNLIAAGGAATAATALANGVSGLAIDVNFVAGFDANDDDVVALVLTPNPLTGIDKGSFGNIVATSTFGNVTIGVGSRTSDSTIGNVTVTTGSSIVEVGGADRFTHGTAEIQGISSFVLAGTDTKLGTTDDVLSFVGTVGNLSASSPFGIAQITGDFNNTGTITLIGSAKVDVDTNTTIATEDPVVVFAGDVFLGTGGAPVYFGGTVGAITLSAVDSSVLAAGLAGKVGTVANTGNVTGNAFFAGTSTAAFVATTNRGTIDIDLELGFDKDNALITTTGITAASQEFPLNRSTGEDTGTLGSVTLTSIDGNIFLTLDSTTTGSSYGAVVVTTGTTITAVSGADVQVAAGNITIDGDNDAESANGNLGTIASIVAKAATGEISLTGKQWNVGPITLTTGSALDIDSNSAVSGEDPIVLDAGDITLGLTIYRNAGTITATTGDLATAGLPAAGDKGNISGFLSFAGALTGGTSSVVASTQQGDIGLTVNSLIFLKAAGDSGLVQDATGTAATNTDDFVGTVGDIVLTSVFGDITVPLSTSSVGKVGGSTDAIGRFSSIGNVTATTGSSYQAVLGSGNDVAILVGDIAIAAGSTSNGILGNVTATTTSGTAAFGVGGTFNNVIGNIALTAGVYTDTISLAAGNVSFGGSYATTNNNGGDFDTVLGTVTLNAVGVRDNAGVGSAGTVSINTNLGGGWTDAGVIGTIETGEQALFTGGAFNATVSDGQVLAMIGASASGFGAALPVTLLKSTGTSTFGGTGTVQVSGGTGSFSSISSFKMEAADGAANYAGDWESPTVTLFSMTSDKGDVTFDGDLELDTANATNFDAVAAKVTEFTLWAKNGNAVFGANGDLGIDEALGVLNRPNLGTASDNRTFVLENITLKAAGTTAAGTVTVNGNIGGQEITNIANLVFDVPTLTGLTTLNGPGAAPAVTAHDIAKITFNGNASLAGATEILASDIGTARLKIGSVDYTSNTAASAFNKGSNLDVIGELIFNGSVAGNVATSLITGSRGEIEASSIGKITINAPVDPTTTVKYTAQNLDILASNSRGGVATGEALVVFGFSTLDAANAITAFNIGDIVINHNLQGNSTGSTIFDGSNAISSIGGMGNLTIKSTVAGSVQAPLLTPTGAAWFAVGDGNGLGNATAQFDSAGNGVFAAYLDVNTTAALAGDKVSIGAISIDAASTYAPPAPQSDDFANVGGSNAVATDGLVILAAAVAPTVGDTAATRAAAYTELYGYIASVEIKNAAIRPDADASDFTVTAGGAFLGGAGNVANGDGDLGALIAVAGDTSTAGIGDIINDLNPALVPLLAGEGRILGDALVDTEYDQGDVVVYVL